jgi:phosphate transport system substrate-binding protein
MVRVDGSSTVFPITEAVAEGFQKAHPGVRVTVGVSGTRRRLQESCAPARSTSQTFAADQAD